MSERLYAVNSALHIIAEQIRDAELPSTTADQRIDWITSRPVAASAGDHRHEGPLVSAKVMEPELMASCISLKGTRPTAISFLRRRKRHTFEPKEPALLPARLALQIW